MSQSRIVLRNTQRSVSVDVARIMSEVNHILQLVGYPDFGIHVWLTTDQTVRNYNREYRHIDKPTDILSFPYWPELRAGQRIKTQDPDDMQLGDLIISMPYVYRESVKYRVTVPERLRVLLVHGVCHLLGYDHIVDTDWRRMRAKEAYILKKLTEATSVRLPGALSQL